MHISKFYESDGSFRKVHFGEDGATPEVTYFYDVEGRHTGSTWD